MMNYIKSLIQNGTMDSSKSFALIVGVLIGALIGLVTCFILIYDVWTNGYIKTNLNDLGIFLLCVGGYIAGGGINKAISESTENKTKCNNDQEKA